MSPLDCGARVSAAVGWRDEVVRVVRLPNRVRVRSVALSDQPVGGKNLGKAAPEIGDRSVPIAIGGLYKQFGRVLPKGVELARYGQQQECVARLSQGCDLASILEKKDDWETATASHESDPNRGAVAKVISAQR